MIWLVPGIRACDPADQFGPLRSILLARGLRTGVVDYGYVLLPINNRRARRELRDKAEPGDTLVGYSNGAYAVWQEAERLRPRHVVLISPALRRDAEWPDCVESITVFYSPGDWAVELGGIYSAVISFMPWRWGTPHGFGRMGVDGPDTDDKRVESYEMGERICHSWYDYPHVVRKIATTIEQVAA